MEPTKQPDHMSERIFCRNRLKPRAYYLPAQTLLLSGRWKFHFAASPLETDPSSDDADAWSSIDVPGHFQLQGYGSPQYTNIDYPFPMCPPFVPSDNPTGVYETTFAVPDDWKKIEGGLNYRLRFEGVDSAFHLWLNDVELGYSQGSRNAAEFDISHQIRQRRGETNVLRVKVYQWSDGSYIEDQDMWWLSGIYRDVALLAMPKRGHIEDYFIRTNMGLENQDAVLDIGLVYDVASAASVTLTLLDANGQPAAPPKACELSPDRTTHSCAINVQSPLKWSAERPHLYSLNLVLSNKGQLLQEIDQQVGFRTVFMRNGQLNVNGVPITLKGVNRHDHHPKFGRAVPIDFVKHDLMLMKRHNINALRCSHYPNDPRLVQFANEIGLYVFDECDLECHGAGVDLGQLPSDDPAWKEAYLDRMQQLVHRDKNNPCVIVWSLGNEAFYGQNHQAMYEWSKSFDETRPVHYEGDHDFRASDICSYMYQSIAELVDLATRDGDNYEKPILLQEYGHAMGLGPGGLKEYQETYRKYRRLQGGFIWEWANHGLLKKIDDGSERSFYAYGGDFGDKPNDYNFVMDGLCNSEHQPGPGLAELKQVYQPISVRMQDNEVYVRNLHDFATLKDIEYRGVISRFLSSDKEVVLASERGDMLETAPGTEQTLSIVASLRENFDLDQSETWLKLSFHTSLKSEWVEPGHEVARAEFRLDRNRNVTQQPLIRSLDCPQVRLQGETLNVSTPTSALSFDLIRARIVKWTSMGLDMIYDNKGPQLTFWRALTDNDRGGAAGDWQSHGVNAMTQEVRAVEHAINEESGTFVIVVRSWIAPPVLAWGFETITTYTFHSVGELLIHVRASPKGPAPGTLPRIGLEMMLPEDRTYAQWFGLGPCQTYKDMKEAGSTGVWKRSLDEMMVIYEMPQENGNRTETRWVKVTDERGIGIKAVLQRIHKPEVVQNANLVMSNTKSTYAHGSSASAATSPLEKWEMVHGQEAKSISQNGFDFAISRYTAADLNQAQHPHELQGSEGVVFRIDEDHHGLGSASCGPDTQDQYKLKMRDFNFTVSLEPIVG